MRVCLVFETDEDKPKLIYKHYIGVYLMPMKPGGKEDLVQEYIQALAIAREKDK